MLRGIVAFGLVTVGLGALTTACAGPERPGAAGPQVRIEALPGGGERSVIQGAVTLDVEGAAAIEDAQVVIECAACEPKVLREAFTNADGLYSVRDLPPGTYDVWVIQTPARYDSERLRVSRQELDTRRSVDLAAGVRARVDFALPLRSAIIVD